jgi:hypothetical protein
LRALPPEASRFVASAAEPAWVGRPVPAPVQGAAVHRDGDADAGAR